MIEMTCDHRPQMRGAKAKGQAGIFKSLGDKVAGSMGHISRTPKRL